MPGKTYKIDFDNKNWRWLELPRADSRKHAWLQLMICSVVHNLVEYRGCLP
jgi:hypothetical protein